MPYFSMAGKHLIRAVAFICLRRPFSTPFGSSGIGPSRSITRVVGKSVMLTVCERENSTLKENGTIVQAGVAPSMFRASLRMRPFHYCGDCRCMLRVMSRALHTKARGGYPGAPATVKRFAVEDSKVEWSIDFADYAPTEYTAAAVAAKPVWADPDVKTDKSAQLKWHEIDGKNDRRSFEGKYAVVDGLPRNPRGRTGMTGRGLLGKWGPNHAADPVVTRYDFDAFSSHVFTVFLATFLPCK